MARGASRTVASGLGLPGVVALWDAPSQASERGLNICVLGVGPVHISLARLSGQELLRWTPPTLDAKCEESDEGAAVRIWDVRTCSREPCKTSCRCLRRPLAPCSIDEASIRTRAVGGVQQPPCSPHPAKLPRCAAPLELEGLPCGRWLPPPKRRRRVPLSFALASRRPAAKRPCEATMRTAVPERSAAAGVARALRDWRPAATGQPLPSWPIWRPASTNRPQALAKVPWRRSAGDASAAAAKRRRFAVRQCWDAEQSLVALPSSAEA